MQVTHFRLGFKDSSPFLLFFSINWNIHQQDW